MTRYLILPWLWAGLLSACPVCEQQPKGSGGITHGTGPESVLDPQTTFGVTIAFAIHCRFCRD